jgi:hypothetical protein
VTGRVRFAGEMPAGLRQNQRVSVRILMDRRDAVLKLDRGAFYEAGGGTTAYAWFVWDKDAPAGTELRWFKPGYKARHA